jgi:hypothetical protein
MIVSTTQMILGKKVNDLLWIGLSYSVTIKYKFLNI